MSAILLDTHALLWLVNAAPISSDADKAIAVAQRDRALQVSPISGWELAVAARKAAGPGRPDLGGKGARPWFKAALNLTGAKLSPITEAVAFEAAAVPTIYNRKDPGDCFLIATARIRGIPLITRDQAIRDLARDRPDYLTVIAC